MTDKTKHVFQKEVANSLGRETGWESHELMVVGVRRKYWFNDTVVSGMVEIQQLDSDEFNEWQENFDNQDFTDRKSVV